MTTDDSRAGLPAGPGAAPGSSSHAREPRVVDPRGRSKVLRPLPDADRAASLSSGLVAYERGDFYLAHEELEPAWMAAADPGERELLGGLIKLAAAHVHAARGNAVGVATNLRGARTRLATAAAAGIDGGFDLPALLAAVDDRLAELAALPATPAEPRGTLPDPPHDVAGPPGRARRPPLDLPPLALPRRTRA
jgi:hypothetical protein